MRAGVWWSAAALILLVAATSALRTSQVESRRNSRRLSTNSDTRGPTSTEKTEDVQSTFRPRSHRRREEPTSSTPRESFRSRSRSKITDPLTSNVVTEQIQAENGRNERFDSRRTNRLRTRPIETETNVVTSFPSRDSSVKNKVRQSNRRPQYTTTAIPLSPSSSVTDDSRRDNNRRPQLTTTEAPLQLSSPNIDDIKTEIISSNFDDFTRTVPREEDITTVQFKRRSSTARIIENDIQTSTKATRTRGRINTRVNIKLDDMASSGATNILSISEIKPINDKSSEDLRNSRKLRYRTRLSDTDTNLTGEGIGTSNEIAKSLKKQQIFTSQPESRTSSLVSNEKKIQRNSERTSNSSNVKSMRVVRRPLLKEKDKSPSLPKPSDSEVGDDDNYPESFKALIQAKNASTQVSSPPSESLSVKATHKVINTYTQPSQSSNTSPESNNTIRLRSKSNTTVNELKNEDNRSTESSTDSSKSKSQEYRLRGTYSPRTRKFNTVNTANVQKTTTSSPVSVKTSYKLTRKLKSKPSNAIEPPSSENPRKIKRFESAQPSQKAAVRSQYYSRKNVGKNTDKSGEPSNKENVNSNNITSSAVNNKVKLPRTSYYSRLRNSVKNNITTTTEKLITLTNKSPMADKKNENTVDMPLIFTLLNNPSKSTINENISKQGRSGDTEEFLLALSSKESQENNVDGEIATNAEESENKPVINIFPTTQKYHANYKDQSLASDLQKKDIAVTAATPPIRNIQTRKYTRKVIKSKDKVESTSVYPAIKSKERSLRKYSDTFSKTTEASTNGITTDAEKPKSRFSSKYKASYLDKPFYKPTVPTVTPTTAWLKFFVTNHQLTESIKEPKWFEGNDFNDVTTELISRQKVATTAFIHESSTELVVGEEILLGPDMNAISFTQTRSTLSSADLRLSESLVKPSHVMNVEASNHSPSVTVSIFDALAEILTSTPRLPISSTTEVPQQIYTDSVIKQTLNGVSSNTNVNSVSDLSSQGTTMSTDSINTITTVQITDQTTPIVLNRLSVEESVSPSLKLEEMNIMSTTTPQTTPIPTPTTPISARRPFAIKVLYSDTERPTDIIMTSFEPTTKWSTTENPKMVYNTVSDLLLSNNKLVSSELTSMLSNNIKDIIGNLDEESRSRLSVDMANLLKTLVPKAMNKVPSLSDVDDISNTTPYSLEDIKDTENVNISFDSSNNVVNENFDLKNINVLQNVRNDYVNSTEVTTSPSVSEVTTEQAVNSTSDSQFVSSTILPLLESKSTVANIITTTNIDSSNSPRSEDLFLTILPTIPTTTSIENIEVFDIATLSGLEMSTTTVDSIQIDTSSKSTLNPTNKPLPVPFFTNSNVDDFTSRDTSNFSTMITKPDSRGAFDDTDNIDIDDPSQISRLQLWILSKKARVLKMIEQLIREHNEEVANAPLTELLDQPNKVILSNRLTEIMNTMDSTTVPNDASVDITTNVIDTPDSGFATVTSRTPFEFSNSVDTETLNNRLKGGALSTTATNDILSTTLISTEVDDITKTDETDTIAYPTTSEMVNILHRTNAETTDQTFLEKTTETQELVEKATSTTENERAVTQVNSETTTSMIDLEIISKITTEGILETTIQAGIETTTATLINETKPIDEITIITPLNGSSKPTIPKKDYVIFGILPNNTVVRKDPNDNVLESLTEASPYIIYGVLPNNTVIRKFPNGTRVPRIMQKIDVLPISPWSLRNPYSPIHNNPTIVRPQVNPIRVSTNTVISTDLNNETENRLTTDTVNNQQIMISSSAPNLKDSSSLGLTTATIKPSAEKSTASHVLSLRTTTMLPSVHEILLNSLSSATKEEMVISSMTSSTLEPRILTLDIDPETKQIRTEKPGDGSGNTIFKFIPIDEITVPPQDTNVLRLASTKAPTAPTEKEIQIVTPISVTEINKPITQIETRTDNIDEPTTTVQSIAATPNEIADGNKVQSSETISTVTVEPTTESTTFVSTEESKVLTTLTQTPTPITNTPEKFTTSIPTIPPLITTSDIPTTTIAISPITNSIFESETAARNDNNVNTETTRAFEDTISTTDTARITSNTQSIPNKNNNADNGRLLQNILSILSTTIKPTTSDELNQIKLLQALLLGAGQDPQGTNKATQSTTSRSIEDDLRQFEEDTKLLKALLQATGRNPDELKIPTISDIKPATVTTPTTSTPTTTVMTTTLTTPTTTMITTTPTTPLQTTTTTIESTTSMSEEMMKIKEDALLLQALLQATGQNVDSLSLPIISGITSNVRIASNPLTTSVESNPTTPMNIRPIYTTQQPIEKNSIQTEKSQIISVLPTLQEQQSTVAGDIGISTTYPPFDRRITTSTNSPEILPTLSARRAPSLPQVTTEIPSTSTFSVEEDLAFLNSLKNVLNTNNNNDNPEAALANRVIALAVERSLSEIQTETQADLSRPGQNIAMRFDNAIRTTTIPTTTTRMTTTTENIPVVSTLSTPSLEDDIKQFEEDTKLLQALLKATGQDPTKFNIPTLSNVKVSPEISPVINEDLKLLSNLLASPSPLNEPFDPLTQKPNNQAGVIPSITTTNKPFGVKIAVKDNLKNVQDDAQLLQTLIKLKDAQETTTQRNKLTITGQSSDEALQQLIQQAKPTVMQSESTKSSVSLSTEYGNSNDALLAALLKEQGFGPTTASSLDEQVRLAALLNQVVVTPKARRTTTLPPPPPAPRRPILDGLAWLWQQWRDTAPGTGSGSSRTSNKRPVPTSRPTARPTAAPSAAAPSRVNWFGSGPFVGNADDRPSSNRIPLEPPRVVAAEQAPGRGQLVSAAINVTRAFSQFLGAAIQGAALTVQNVIRAGQKAATDVYTNGSG